MKKILIICTILMSGTIHASSIIDTAKTKTITIMDSTDAEYPGGMDVLLKLLGNELRYPQYERERNIQGKVEVQFVVKVDGTCTNFTIIENPNQNLSNEAIRVLKKMGKWKPATRNGMKTESTIKLPVTFALSTEGDATKPIGFWNRFFGR
jgi:periplasmic protein TonB